MEICAYVTVVALVAFSSAALHVAASNDDNFIIPRHYPLFKQCNSSWGNDVMEKETICAVGCLMSSVSMALNFCAVSIDGLAATPATLNQWLRRHHGYLPDDALIESSLANLSAGISYVGTFHGNTSISDRELITYLTNGVVTIAHVRKGTHFVLMTGWDVSSPGVWAVNDPGFSQGSYTSVEIVGYRVFAIKG